MDERVAVVGLGRLGSCLVRALQKAGVTVSALASRDAGSAQPLAAALGLESTLTPVERIGSRADWVFVCVPDRSLPEVASRLGLGPAQCALHCSGALDRSPLTAAGANGAQLAVFHPLQSFAAAAPAERFQGIALGVDAGPPLFERLWQLAERLGAAPFSLVGVDRARYHTAAVFASNYLVALHAAAAGVWRAAGLPQGSARRALVTLSRGSLDNLDQHELAAALTGPIARGDAAIIAGHLAALSDDPERASLYRALGRELLRLPLGHGPDTLAALERALAEPA